MEGKKKKKRETCFFPYAPEEGCRIDNPKCYSNTSNMKSSTVWTKFGMYSL